MYAMVIPVLVHVLRGRSKLCSVFGGEKSKKAGKGMIEETEAGNTRLSSSGRRLVFRTPSTNLCSVFR